MIKNDGILYRKGKKKMTEAILIGIFIVSTIVGYILINNVPSLLHTPLMSGMNALSGVTVLGAIEATAGAVALVAVGDKVFGCILGFLAIVFATINVVGGFMVTDRMLKMIVKKGKDKTDEGRAQ